MFSSSVMLKMLPWGIAAVMALAAAACLHLYQSERDAFVAYRAEVTAIGKAQEAQIKKEKEQAEYNLKQVRKDYEAKLPAIRAGAVRTYCLRQPTLCQPATASADASGQQVDDGAKPELMAPDPEFIRNAAEDAAKLSAFQDYCKRNNCPIEE